jgi:hypothetical protein
VSVSYRTSQLLLPGPVSLIRVARLVLFSLVVLTSLRTVLPSRGSGARCCSSMSRSHASEGQPCKSGMWSVSFLLVRVCVRWCGAASLGRFVRPSRGFSSRRRSFVSSSRESISAHVSAWSHRVSAWSSCESAYSPRLSAQRSRRSAARRHSSAFRSRESMPGSWVRIYGLRCASACVVVVLR